MPGEVSGQFLLWAEIAGHTKRLRRGEHPYQIRRTDLDALLDQTWPGLSPAGGLPAKKPKLWIVLPGDGKRPSPSLELQAEREDEIAEPTAWTAWQVDTVELDNPIWQLCLHDLRHLAGTTTVRIGQDLDFWQRLARRVAWAVRRHEYLPAIFPQRTVTKGGGKKTRKPTAEFKAGWELAHGVEDGIAASYSRAIPGACRAMWAREPSQRNGDPPLHEPEGLVRHFLAVCLQRLVVRTRFTQKAAKQVEGSVVQLAIAPTTATSKLSIGYARPIEQPTWAHWIRWRDRIQRSALEADERICFRLAEASPEAPDVWKLEWLLSSRRDPSLLIPLADFWAERSLVRPSARSMREVLLQLGQAARIYGRLWEGMNSSAPAEVLLGREEALDFLKQQAPILQGAGFRVIVPAWWTATGQRRLRLRLTTRGSGGAESVGSESSGIFGFDSLLEFNAEVVMDGKALTSREWERLVASKEGLVEIRGQWMELRSDELVRLEEYWQTGSELQQMTVSELLRAQAESETTGVEVVYEAGVGRMLSALRNNDSLELLDQPDAFVGTLREYQVRGFSWLAYLERIGLGACLADDMGLGKTVQVLATILEDKVRNPEAGPTLLIAPTSVLGNWQREAKRFARRSLPTFTMGPSEPRARRCSHSLLRAWTSSSLRSASRAWIPKP